jgi:tetratricopeptide (TPR) repeat protein
VAELNGEAGDATGPSRIAETWNGLSEDTRLFLRAACLFDTERIPRDALATLLGVEGWDADLFQIALDDARCEAGLSVDGALLRVSPDTAAFIRREAGLRLPEDLVETHLNAFCSAAVGLRDPSSDARVVERLLAYPLDREAWEGLGSDVDEFLSELTPTLGHCLLTLDRHAQALGWFERALPHLEREAEDVNERTQQGAQSLTALWEVLFELGISQPDTGDGESGPVDRAQTRLERAAGIAERLSAVNPTWFELRGMNCASIADLLVRAKRNEEALLWGERAIRAFEACRKPDGVRSSRRARGLLVLADCLASLGRDADALVWFDRASADFDLHTADREGRWPMVTVALRVGERLFYREEGKRRAKALPWLERALKAYEALAVRDASMDERVGETLTIAGQLHFERAGADAALLPTWLRPSASVDLAHLAEALSYFDRAAELVERADQMSTENRCFIGRYALSMSGLCHHQAGRPAEALASFERSEALVERLGAASQLPIACRLDELRVRGRCQDMLGRGEQAAVFLERAVALALKEAIPDRKWQDGSEDFSALDVAEVETELVELLERIGAAEQVTPDHRVHSLFFYAYGCAEQDRPEEAARWFARVERMAKEGEYRWPHASRRIVMAVTRAVMRSFARADQPEEAISWYQRFFDAYADGMPRSSSQREETKLRRELMALRRDAEQFENLLERRIRYILSDLQRFFGRIDAPEEPDDPGDELEDEESGEDDAARA